MNTAEGYPRCLFLWADAQVLQDPELRVVKVVAPDYDHVSAVPRNRPSGPQRYFGWITLPTTAILRLYIAVDMFSYEYLANGPGALWDPDVFW